MTHEITNLTDIHTLAADPSVTMPIEIHVADDGATAVYDGNPDVGYDSLDDLLGEHTIDPADLVEFLNERGDSPDAWVVLRTTAGPEDVLLRNATGDIVDWTVYDREDAEEHCSVGGARMVAVGRVTFSQWRGLYVPANSR